jgi:hypothetical protein
MKISPRDWLTLPTRACRKSRKDHLCLVIIRDDANRSPGTMDGLAAT